MLPARDQLEILLRGVESVVPPEELEARLAEGKPLRVKLGLDPTAHEVHLGWAVVIGLLRRFQDLGHTAVLIVGDFTAQVGDPSGKSETRARLDDAAVKEYASSVLEEVKGLLNPDNLEVRYNSDWLAALSMPKVLDLASKVTLAQMLERADFSKRYEENEPISLIEFLYPLLQGMDSIAVEADIELGGADQLWNLLMGRELQSRHGQPGQIAVTTGLLVGTDGTRKMSQSYDNFIAIKDPPEEMFGKVMSLPDEVMVDYFTLATEVAGAEVDAIEAGLASGELHPGDTKRRLGREIVGRYWDAESAGQAEAAFDRLFKEHRAPEQVKEFPLPEGDPVWLPGALREAGVVASGSEAKRLVDQGAVKIDGAPTSVEEVSRALLVGRVVQVGKRRFVRFVEPA